jgi:hypothetical protein
MFRVTIRATPDTDVDAEIENLRRAASGAGLEAGLVELVINEADTVVRDFVNRVIRRFAVRPRLARCL